MFWAVIGALFIGFILGVMLTYGGSREKFTEWKPISMHVTSKSTGLRYIADRYRYSMDDDTPYLRIYNINKFEWYPIWHFKDPYLIMMIVDKDYAVRNMLKLCGVDSGKNSTDADEK